jgi:hypothetical protein
VENTLARDDHAPVTGERFGRITQRQSRRTTASTIGGCVSTKGRRNREDLVLKNEKTGAYQNHSAGDIGDDLSSSGASLEYYPAKNKENLPKLKPKPHSIITRTRRTKTTTGTSPGGLKTPQPSCPGDSSLYWEQPREKTKTSLALKELKEEAKPGGGSLGASLPRQPTTLFPLDLSFSLGFPSRSLSHPYFFFFYS